MRTPSRKKPVAAGTEPRTTGYESPDARLATPGSSMITRSGSPRVPATSWSSGPASETRETSARSTRSRTTVS